jgi:outer membrane protein assembly factor BamB
VKKNSRHRTRRAALAILVVPAAVALAAACASAAAAAPASARHDGTGAVITDLRTVETFNFEAGGQPENVTINPDRSLTVSLLGFLTGQPPQLLRISPSGRVMVLVTGDPGEAIGGNARDSEGTIYYNLLSGDPARSGMWRLRPGGSPERIGALPAGQFLNGLTIGAAGKNLYAADSLAGTIWTVPTSGGPVKAWLVSHALAPLESGPGHFGANGVTYHDGAVWASNTDRHTLLRIPSQPPEIPGPSRSSRAT